jgi:predicted enzyme related to lactoylglutathione lyase
MKPVVHLELLTGDLAGAGDLYSELCGWRSERVDVGGGSYVALDLGSRLGGGLVECATERSLWLPYVEVPDVGVATERARALGAAVTLDEAVSATASLFGETPSRVLVSFEESQRTRLERIAAQAGAPLKVVGRTGGTRLSIKAGGAECVSQEVPELEALWRGALGSRLQAEVIATAAE